MIIKKFAVGNQCEAFIEESFSNGFNIISSDDNNKGKTIAIQSMMYTLGNEPAFPATFPYQDYYHILEFEHEGRDFLLLRHNEGFVLKHEDTLMLFDSISELKRYWTKQIQALPKILKNGLTRIVDPVLLLQLFFAGQDKKDTSNIANAGFYNKADYLNMIFSISGLGCKGLNYEEVAVSKTKMAQLKEERSALLKQHKILKSQKATAGYLSAISDKTAFEEKLKHLERTRDVIAELKKARSMAATRRAKWETTIKELRSLNRTMDCGELRCMDCDSTNIAFSASKKSSYSFDVSTAQMRNDIIASIQEKISAYTEEIERYAVSISREQEYLQELMSDESISIESIVAFKSEIFDAADAELRIKAIDSELDALQNALRASESNEQTQKDRQVSLLQELVSNMERVYKEIDKTGNLTFDGLFTKRDALYSGSEATIFHLVKLYSLATVIKHDYPIVIDSFRAEDLSTSKEQIVLNIFSRISNQKIFTTTLKAQELGKYDNVAGINHIDFKDHTASKMLSPRYVGEFKKILLQLSIDLK